MIMTLHHKKANSALTIKNRKFLLAPIELMTANSPDMKAQAPRCNGSITEVVPSQRRLPIPEPKKIITPMTPLAILSIKQKRDTFKKNKSPGQQGEPGN